MALVREIKDDFRDVRASWLRNSKKQGSGKNVIRHMIVNELYNLLIKNNIYLHTSTKINALNDFIF